MTRAASRRRRLAWAAIAIATALGSPATEGAEMVFALHSSAFAPDSEIPTRFTCEGEDVSPPLEWGDPPPATRSFVLIVDDPDAPDPAAPQRTWVHWVVYDLPASARSLPEGSGSGKLPAGARSGLNDWKREGYGGPCPPIGRHRYFHRLYALDVELGELAPATRAAVDRAMQGHVLARAELVGTYQKKQQKKK